MILNAHEWRSGFLIYNEAPESLVATKSICLYKMMKIREVERLEKSSRKEVINIRDRLEGQNRSFFRLHLFLIFRLQRKNVSKL